jgi:hypothetical protein
MKIKTKVKAGINGQPAIAEPVNEFETPDFRV